MGVSAEPSTGKPLGRVASCSADDFVEAIEAAHAAQAAFWEDTTATERAAFLKRWYSLIMDNADDCELHHHYRHVGFLLIHSSGNDHLS